MRAGVEPGCLEFMTHVGKRRLRLIAERQSASTDEAIDIEHAEANAFHVKCPNGELERRTLVEDGIAGGALRLALETRHKTLETVLGSFPMVCIGRHGSRVKW